MPDREETYRRCVDYLVNVLQKNPLEHGAEIISGRNRLLRLETTPAQGVSSVSLVAHRERRQAIVQQIESLRKQFWTAPLTELQGALGRLDAADFPDLQAAVNRLTTVAADRSRFPTLVRDRHFDGDFFSAFKEVLVSSPRDVAVLKENMLVSFANSSTRRRGKRMIALLQSEMPAVYALEAGWLSTLARQKRSTARVKAVSQRPVLSTASNFSIPWWWIVVAMIIIRAIIQATKN
jgi:hypothetical protein